MEPITYSVMKVTDPWGMGEYHSQHHICVLQSFRDTPNTHSSLICVGNLHAAHIIEGYLELIEFVD